MPKLLEFENADGSRTLVSVSLPGEDVRAVSRVSDKALETVEKVAAGFEEVLRPVVGMGASLRKALEGSDVKQATLEVGLQFTAKGTIYVVESQAQVGLKVTLTIVA